MRHRAYGRHRRYPSTRPARACLVTVLAVLAVSLAASGLTGTFTASARSQTHDVILTDRAAAYPASEPDLGMQAAELRSAAQARVAQAVLARARAAAVFRARTYTVRPGDSMAAVSLRHCGQAREWTGIYAASRKLGWTAANANQLSTGQHLYLSCAYLPAMLRFAPAPPPPPRTVLTAAVHGSARGYTAAARTYRASPASAYRAAARGSYGTVSASSYGGYQACVITRESGGRSQVMNASGHYGLYQFDAPTWASGGGSPADFGHASVAEQNRVFAAVYAARGTQPWSPSDGC